MGHEIKHVVEFNPGVKPAMGLASSGYNLRHIIASQYEDDE